ncbi:hypothetical protein SE17_08805 [Kouleothrix aurantiaca]|uniref:Uncharacterized protein n=1 Tax=Kouleothrix aurantiaca TaxID=186479 RepID=A0A0P9FK73_9CHLR|nr:hypothetical protein SE17_08805 [Kouleothrix aurantiaca]
MDNERPHTGRLRSQRAAMVFASLVLLGSLGLCLAGGVALCLRSATLPNIARQLGPVRVVAHETVLPQCAFGMPCAAPLRSFRPAEQRYYVVWLMVRWPGSPPLIHRLLAQPLRS